MEGPPRPAADSLGGRGGGFRAFVFDLDALPPGAADAWECLSAYPRLLRGAGLPALELSLPALLGVVLLPATLLLHDRSLMAWGCKVTGGLGGEQGSSAGSHGDGPGAWEGLRTSEVAAAASSWTQGGSSR